MPSPSTTSPWRSSTPPRAARAKARYPLAELVQRGQIEYIDFPPALVGKYQCFTQADLARLRATGCDHAFADVATGVARYASALAAAPA